jgi:hypothetical protein
MKGRAHRHVQLNLRLTDPPPAVVLAEKNEELSRALVDLLLEALTVEAATGQAGEGSDDER